MLEESLEIAKRFLDAHKSTDVGSIVGIKIQNILEQCITLLEELRRDVKAVLRPFGGWWEWMWKRFYYSEALDVVEYAERISSIVDRLNR